MARIRKRANRVSVRSLFDGGSNGCESLLDDLADELLDRLVLSKIAPREQWLMQFMKFMHENFRAQRFAPATGAIQCRFDGPCT